MIMTWSVQLVQARETAACVWTTVSCDIVDAVDIVDARKTAVMPVDSYQCFHKMRPTMAMLCSHTFILVSVIIVTAEQVGLVRK